MSVILSKEDRMSYRKPDTVCTICSKKLGLPYVEWHGTDLFICAPCCRTIKRGLMADMVQAAAIAELHDLGYRGNTLVRTTRQQVEDDERKQIAAEQQIMTGMPPKPKNNGKSPEADS